MKSYSPAILRYQSHIYIYIYIVYCFDEFPDNSSHLGSSQMLLKYVTTCTLLSNAMQDIINIKW